MIIIWPTKEIAFNTRQFSAVTLLWEDHSTHRQKTTKCYSGSNKVAIKKQRCKDHVHPIKMKNEKKNMLAIIAKPMFQIDEHCISLRINSLSEISYI